MHNREERHRPHGRSRSNRLLKVYESVPRGTMPDSPIRSALVVVGVVAIIAVGVWILTLPKPEAPSTQPPTGELTHAYRQDGVVVIEGKGPGGPVRITVPADSPLARTAMKLQPATKKRERGDQNAD